MAAPEIRLLGPREPRETFQALAQLHASEISGGFLTSLGQPVLQQLYQAIHQSDDAFILVAEQGGTIVGFLCGSLDTKRVYRRVLLHAWPRVLPKLIGKLARWSTLQRCWETLRYPAKPTTTPLPPAEILNFCVSRAVQRSGIGRALFAAMQAEFRHRHVAAIKIVTGAEQHSAIRFYESVGAQPAGRLEVHANVESRLFVFVIQDCQSKSEKLA
jgi:ribosomal protein S18 acetylase RimI-like enzyme